MNEQEFQKSVEGLEIKLTKTILEKLNTYAECLLEYNKHTNLTAIKTIEEVYLKHFYDSLTITKVIDLNKPMKLLDIGTGAGFPGLVLAIVFPNLQVELLDSNHKKIDFLEYMIQKLELTNVKTIYRRSEEYAREHQNEYDIVTSRAVAELRILIEISFPLLKIGGYFIAMKSSIDEELQIANDTIELLNGRVEQISSFELPNKTGMRNIIKIKKEKSTPSIYPRAYATILKKTLKKK